MGVTTKGVFKRAEWLKERVGYQGDDCLLWPFAKNYNGYGNLKYAEGKWTYAHRLMCIYAHGEPPAPKSVAAHSCGNGGKGCVNPRHLSWKSNAANQKDRHAQGTFRANDRGRTGKLTPKQVLEIRALKGKINQRLIGKRFGVSFQCISMIHQGKTWTQVLPVDEK
jgi:hypothetical protein